MAKGLAGGRPACEPVLTKNGFGVAVARGEAVGSPAGTCVVNGFGADGYAVPTAANGLYVEGTANGFGA